MEKKANYFTQLVVDLLEKEVVKAVLLKVLGKAVGFRAWLIKFVLKELVFDEVVEPGAHYLKRKVLLYYDKRKGAYVYKNLMQATKDGNLDDWRKWASKL